MKTAADLEQQLNKAKSALADIQNQIAEKLSIGEDVRHLQRRRDGLTTKVADLAPAVVIAQDREKQAIVAADEERLKSAREDAQLAAVALTKAACTIDAALADLETKFTAFELARLDTERALRLAGLADGSKIKRTVGHALRWATWASAPEFATDSQLSRVEMTRRRSFEQSITATIPHIGEEQ